MTFINNFICYLQFLDKFRQNNTSFRKYRTFYFIKTPIFCRLFYVYFHPIFAKFTDTLSNTRSYNSATRRWIFFPRYCRKAWPGCIHRSCLLGAVIKGGYFLKETGLQVATWHYWEGRRPFSACGCDASCCVCGKHSSCSWYYSDRKNC